MPAHQYSLKSFRDLLAAYVKHANTQSVRKGDEDPATVIYQAELQHLLELQMALDALLEKPDAKHNADEQEGKQQKALQGLLNKAYEKSKQFHLDYILLRNKTHGRGTPGVLEETDGVPHDPLNFNNSNNFTDSIRLGLGTHGHRIISKCLYALASGLLYVHTPRKMDVYPLENVKRIVKNIDEAMEPIAKFLKLTWASPIAKEGFFAGIYASLFQSVPSADAKAQAAQNPNTGTGLGAISFGDAPVVVAAAPALKPGSGAGTIN